MINDKCKLCQHCKNGIGKCGNSEYNTFACEFQEYMDQPCEQYEVRECSTTDISD